MQNFINLVHGEHVQIWGWMDGGVKFNGKLAISRKCWEIRPRLLLITNWKWHMRLQMKWKSLTLDDLEGHWQPVWSAIVATAGLLVSIYSSHSTFLHGLCLFLIYCVCHLCSSLTTITIIDWNALIIVYLHRMNFYKILVPVVILHKFILHLFLAIAYCFLLYRTTWG